MFPVLESFVAIVVGLYGYGTVAGSPVYPWTIVGGFILAAVLARWGVVTTARIAATDRRRAAAFRHGAFSRIRIAYLGIYAYQIFVGNWPGIVQHLGVGHWILVDEMIVLAPYGALLLLAWLGAVRADRHISTRSSWTAAQFVAFQARNVLLPLGPIFVLLGIRDALNLLAASNPAVAAFMALYSFVPAVNEGVTIVVLTLLFIAMPFIFRWAWRMKPLEAGPLRRRLEAFSQRVGFRTREILVWPTHRQIPNAAIIGLFPAARYVMMTDGLIEALDEDELESVFAHEVGHAAHHHLLQLLLLSVAYILVAPRLMALLPSFLWSNAASAIVAQLGMMLLYWGGVFGWISWKFERQADVFGATTTATQRDDPDGSSFISALERLAAITGTPREKSGWRHPSIASRTEYLHRYLTDPRLRVAQTRTRRGLQLALAVLVLGVVAWRAQAVPDEWAVGQVYIAMNENRWVDALDLCAEVRSEEPRRNVEYLVLYAVSRRPQSGASVREWIERSEAAVARETDPLELVVPLAALLLRDARTLDSLSITDRAASIGALLRPVLDDESELPDLRAEAAMILGHTQLLLADRGTGSASGPGSRALRLTHARDLLERAESLEAEAGGPEPDADQVLLRADLAARTGDGNEAVRLYRKAWNDEADPSATRATFPTGASRPLVIWIVRAVTGLRQDDYTVEDAEASIAAQHDLAKRFEAEIDDPMLVVQRVETRLGAADREEFSGRSARAAELRAAAYAETSRLLDDANVSAEILSAAASTDADAVRALETALRIPAPRLGWVLRHGLADRIAAAIGSAEEALALETAIRDRGDVGRATDALPILMQMELAALSAGLHRDPPKIDLADPAPFGAAEERLDALLARFTALGALSPAEKRPFHDAHASLLDWASGRLDATADDPGGFAGSDDLERLRTRAKEYAERAEAERRLADEPTTR